MKTMKHSTNNSLREMTSGELTCTQGGSFAYDAGRFIRFMALDLYYGYNNGLGFTVATLDFIINAQENTA
jgi:hypothetical protein